MLDRRKALMVRGRGAIDDEGHGVRLISMFVYANIYQSKHIFAIDLVSNNLPG
jgi:hypothetical protein